jgi:hypothetical protein
MAAGTEEFAQVPDRCDRCGGEARVRIVLRTSNLPLLFCGHHFRKNSAALEPVAVVTHDTRSRLSRDGVPV